MGGGTARLVVIELFFRWLSDVAIELFDGCLMGFVEYMC